MSSNSNFAFYPDQTGRGLVDRSNINVLMPGDAVAEITKRFGSAWGIPVEVHVGDSHSNASFNSLEAALGDLCISWAERPERTAISVAIKQKGARMQFSATRTGLTVTCDHVTFG